MTRTISLAPLTILEIPPADMVTCAAQAGYSHLGLRLAPVLPQGKVEYPIIGQTQVMREVLRRLNDTGLRILDVEFVRLGPETRVADYQSMLETGAQLGARHVLAGGDDPDESRLAERFGELCDAAAPFGFTVNLEPIPLFELGTLAQARRVLEAAERPNCGIVIDPIHFFRAPNSFEDIARLPRKWLHYMQFCDAPAGQPDQATWQHQVRSERMIPGEGGLDLVGLLRALPRDFPLGLEVPMATLTRTVGAVERARRLLAATRALLAKLEDEPRPS
jgi:sugar phosphate isomerase/epimerase